MTSVAVGQLVAVVVGGLLATQIEATGKPFYMPFRVRFAYDRVYQGNVSQVGLLRGRLPELVPAFYTRLTAISWPRLTRCTAPEKRGRRGTGEFESARPRSLAQGAR
jgi:hypothetical protein